MNMGRIGLPGADSWPGPSIPGTPSLSLFGLDLRLVQVGRMLDRQLREQR